MSHQNGVSECIKHLEFEDIKQTSTGRVHVPILQVSSNIASIAILRQERTEKTKHGSLMKERRENKVHIAA